MIEERMKSAMQNKLPDVPDGFDARSDMQLLELTTPVKAKRMKLSIGWVMALVLVCVLATGAVAATLNLFGLGDFISRYAKDAYRIRHRNKAGEEKSLPELMDMDISTAIGFCRGMANVEPKLSVLRDLGLGYLTLGEETPSLSGGEAQRLKLASEMGRTQSDSVFVFDEPTIGLHPLDVRTLMEVFSNLIDHGATVIVIEHDCDVIRNADYIIDMGPGGGEEGGRIVACGTPEEIRRNPESITGKYI